MIRKGQVLHREGVTSRWQVRHCQKNQNKKSPRRAKAKASCTPDGAQWGCYPELLDEIVWIFFQETWGVMTLRCFWKYIPACQRKTQPRGFDDWQWWDPLSALSLGPFRCDTSQCLCMTGAGWVTGSCLCEPACEWLPPFYLNVFSASVKHGDCDRLQMKMPTYIV